MKQSLHPPSFRSTTPNGGDRRPTRSWVLKHVDVRRAIPGGWRLPSPSLEGASRCTSNLTVWRLTPVLSPTTVGAVEGTETSTGFAAGKERWRARLGPLRQVVRQTTSYRNRIRVGARADRLADLTAALWGVRPAVSTA